MKSIRIQFWKKIISLGLCFQFLFPPTVIYSWQENAFPKPKGISQSTEGIGVSGDAKLTGMKNHDRKALIQIFHRQFWRMSKVLDRYIPRIYQLNVDDYYTFFEPYRDCVIPSLKNISSDQELELEKTSKKDKKDELKKALELIDAQILVPLQDAFTSYFEKPGRIDELKELPFEPLINPNHRAEFEPVEDLNRQLCFPRVISPQNFNFGSDEGGDLSGVSSGLEQVESGIRSLAMPVFLQLSAIDSERVSHLEVRLWLTWLATLREYRDLIKKYYVMLDPTAIVSPSPPLKFHQLVGQVLSRVASGMRVEGNKKLEEAFRNTGGGAESVSSKEIADRILSGASFSELLPSVKPCYQSNLEPRDFKYCFFDAEKRDDETEKMVLSLQDPERVSPGVLIETIRKMAIKSLLAAYSHLKESLKSHPDVKANPALRKQIEIPEACIPSGKVVPTIFKEDLRHGTGNESLKPLFEEHLKMNAVGERQLWLSLFSQSVLSMADGFLSGKNEILLPSDKEFYREAQRLSDQWVDLYFSERYRLGIEAENEGQSNSIDEKKARIQVNLKGYSFDQSMMQKEGEEESLFAILLMAELTSWSKIIWEELSQLAPNEWEDKKAIILEMVKQIVIQVLIDSLKMYVTSIVSGELLDVQLLEQIWNEKVRPLWQKRVLVETIEINTLSEKIVSIIFSTKGLREMIDLERVSEAKTNEELTDYVRKIDPESAVRAWDTKKYLELEMEQTAWWRLPVVSALGQRAGLGEGNYDEKRFWTGFREGFNPDIPACFQIPDGEGHERINSNPIEFPDSRNSRAYQDHYIELIQTIARRHEKELTETLLDKGYSDAIVSKLFPPWGRVSHLSQKIIDEFSKVAQASNYLDLAKLSEGRRDALKNFEDWVNRKGAAEDYYRETKEFVKLLHFTYLKPVLDHIESHDGNKERVDQGSEELQRKLNQMIREGIILSHLIEDESIIHIYQQYRERANKEEEYLSLSPLRVRLEEFGKKIESVLLDVTGKKWEQFCISKNSECKALVTEVLSPFDDRELLFKLYRHRFLSFGKLILDSLYQTKEKDLKIDDFTDQIYEAWLGEKPIEVFFDDSDRLKSTQVLDEIRKVLLEEYHLSVSKSGERPLPLATHSSLIDESLRQWESKINPYFDIWYEGMVKRRKKIVDAIHSQNKEDFLPAYEQLVIFIHLEYGRLQGVSSPVSNEEEYLSALSSLILPSFSQFHDEMIRRIHIVTKVSEYPDVEIQRRQESLKSLRTNRANLLEKIGDESSKPITRIDSQVEHELSMIHLARERLKSWIELKRILKNYFSASGFSPVKKTLEKLSVSRGAVSFGNGLESEHDEIWKLFVARQFLDSRSDLNGNDLSLTFRQMKKDLDLLSMRSRGLLIPNANDALSYLRQLEKNTSILLKDESLRSIFSKQYTRMIETEVVRTNWVEFLPITEKSPSITFDASAELERLERIWAIGKAVNEKRSLFQERLLNWFNGEPNQSDSFLTWLNETVYPLIKKADVKALIGEGVPSELDVLRYTNETAKTLRSKLELLVQENSNIPQQYLSDFWAFVQEASDIYISPHFTSLVSNEEHIHWSGLVPSSNIPRGEVEQGILTSTSDAIIHEALVELFSRPEMTKEKLQMILPYPTSISVSIKDDSPLNKAQLINELSNEDRRKTYDEIRSLILGDTKQRRESFDLRQWFSKKETLEFDYDSWNNQIIKMLFIWSQHRSDFAEKKETSLSTHIFSVVGPMIFNYTHFTIDNGKLKKNSIEVSETISKESISAFSEMTDDQKFNVIDHFFAEYLNEKSIEENDFASKALKRRIEFEGLKINDIEFRLNSIPQASPFKGMFESRVIGSHGLRVQSESEQLLEYFSEFYVLNPGLREAEKNYNEWKNYALGQRKIGLPLGTIDQMSFLGERSELESYFIPQSIKTDYSNLFETWFESLKRDPRSDREFENLRRFPLSLTERGHIWNLYPTLEAFSQSTSFQQFVSLLRLMDNNNEASPEPGSYPYFLALLNWHLNHYGTEIDIKARERAVDGGLGARPASERELSYLLGPLIDVMKLDLRNFSGLKTFIIDSEANKKVTLEDMHKFTEGILQSAIGVGKNRFLNNKLPIPDVDLRRVFPIIDPNERYEYCSRENFSSWWPSTEDTEKLQLYRVFSQSETEWPLYHEFQAIELQLIGEKNIQNWEKGGSIFFREDVNNDRKSFGQASIPNEVVEEILRRSITAGVSHDSAGHDEKLLIKNLIEFREQYLDFRNAINQKYRSYPFQKGVGRYHLQGLSKQIQEVLKKFVGSEVDAVPDFVTEDDGLTDSSYRQVLGRALYWGGLVFQEKIFGGKSIEEKEKLRKLNILIDSYYSEEAKKRSVKDSLLEVGKNIHTQLDKLCQSDFSWVKNDNDFEKASEDFRDTRIVFYDQLRDFLFVESGWLPESHSDLAEGESTAERTERRLQNLQHQYETEYDLVLKRVRTFTQWSMILFMAGWFYGKGTPAAGRMLMSSRWVQIPMGWFAFLFGSAVAWTSADEIVETYWREPNRINGLESIASSQSFNGASLPLMKDSTAAEIDIFRNENRNARHSIWPWLMHAISFNIAYQTVLKPIYQYAKMFILWGVQKRYPLLLANLRLARDARVIEAVVKNPIDDFESLAKNGEGSEKVTDALVTALRAKRGPNGEIIVGRSEAKILASQAKLEYRDICRSTSRDPFTGFPLEVNETSRFPSIFHGRYLNRLKELRRSTESRLSKLKGWSERLEGTNPRITENELYELMAQGPDPAALHTPLLWRFLVGTSFPSQKIATLRKIRDISRVHFDILALTDPEMLLMRSTLYQSGIQTGSSALDVSDLFNPSVMKKLKAELPPEVRKFCERIYNESIGLAREYEQMLQGEMMWGEAREVGQSEALFISGSIERRERIQRAVFEWVLEGETDLVTFPLAKNIVDKFSHEAIALSTNYPNLRGFVTNFLREKGLAYSDLAERLLDTSKKLGEWFGESLPSIQEYARKNNRKVEDVIRWMLDEKHPNHRLFAKEKVVGEPDGTIVPIDGSDPVETMTLSLEDGLINHAERLRAILKNGYWTYDVKLLQAIANGDLATVSLRWAQEKELSVAIDDLVKGNESLESPPTTRSSDPLSRPPKRPRKPKIPSTPEETSPTFEDPHPFFDDILPDAIKVRLSKTAQNRISFRWMSEYAISLASNESEKKLITDLLLAIRSPAHGGETILSSEVEVALAALEKKFIGHTDWALLSRSYECVIHASRLREITLDDHQLFLRLKDIPLEEGRRTWSWAREIISLNSDAPLTRQAIQGAKAQALKNKVHPELVERATSMLNEIADIKGSNIISVEQMFNFLRMPRNYLSKLKIEEFDRFISHMPDVALWSKLYNPKEFPLNHEEAAKALSSTIGASESFHRACAESTRLRLQNVREEIEAMVGRRELDRSFQNILTRVQERVSQAEHVLLEDPAHFPLREVSEDEILRFTFPKLEMDPILHERIQRWKDGWINEDVGTLPQAEFWEKWILERGLGNYRLEVISRVAKGDIDASGNVAKKLEELSQIVHYRSIVVSSQSTALNDWRALKSLQDVFEAEISGVKEFNVKTAEEGRRFIVEIFNRFKLQINPRAVFTSQTELARLQNSLRKLLREPIESGQLNESAQKLLGEAINRIRYQLIEERNLPYGQLGGILIESEGVLLPILHNTNSKVPFRILLSREVLSNPKLVHHLLDGRYAIEQNWVKWFTNSRHKGGDFFLELFGFEESRKEVISSLSEHSVRILEIELEHLAEEARLVNDTYSFERIKIALERLR